MVLVDLAPVLATLGTLLSGAVGAYFDRSRKNLQDQEPDRIETAAIAAIEREEASQVAPGSGVVTASGMSAKEFAAEVGRTVRAELEAANKRAGRASMKVNAAFFVAGVLASVAVTLFIHPLH
jgi:hypothetical protein